MRKGTKMQTKTATEQGKGGLRVRRFLKGKCLQREQGSQTSEGFTPQTENWTGM